MDQRERFSDDEESLRAAVAGVLKHHHVVTVGIVAQDSDGRTLVAQPAIQRRDVRQDGTTQFVDHPLLLDVPLHHPGGGGITHTFPIATGDEIISLIASRALDVWHQQGGTSAPMSTRTNSLSDAIAIPGLRSTPRQLEAISTKSAQIRSDDGHHVTDHDPTKGVTHFSADPSTAPASSSFNPFLQATKLYLHSILGASGVLGQAVDGGTTHAHGVTHADGAYMAAQNASHVVRAHPILGALLSALNGQHLVQADPNAGVMVASKTAVGITSAGPLSISAPPGMLSLGGLMGGSISGSALASGAASQNVGTLSGDLGGTLLAPQVVGLTHVDGRTLPLAISDAQAAAAGVPVGGLYRDTSIASGKTVIVMRAA